MKYYNIKPLKPGFYWFVDENLQTNPMIVCVVQRSSGLKVQFHGWEIEEDLSSMNHGYWGREILPNEPFLVGIDFCEQPQQKNEVDTCFYCNKVEPQDDLFDSLTRHGHMHLQCYIKEQQKS